MGIINITPDSFSDGGRHDHVDKALAHGRRLVEEGADILDIGGESTRPGATPVDVETELRRVIPVIRGLKDCGAAISVDTMKPEVMAAALDAGADLINDVNALRAPGALEVAAGSDCGICLMHMQGVPQTMQIQPAYEDVVSEVRQFLQARIEAATDAGIARERIVCDPGFGFGKKKAHNISLFRQLPEFAGLSPLLVGISRKSLFGELTGRPAAERVVASAAAAMLAAMKGASILRVHDVAETVDALRVLHVLGTGPGSYPEQGGRA